MSRNNKSRRQEKKLKLKQKLKRDRRKLIAHRSDTPGWSDACRRATELLTRRRVQEAREVLEEYEAAHPGQPEILRLLLDVYHLQRDYEPYCTVCRRLLEKEPENRSLHLMLAGGYLGEGRIASALQGFQRYVQRWPNDPLADGAHASIRQIEPAFNELARELAVTGDDRLELLAMHEEMMAALASGDRARAIRIGEQLLERQSDFVPAMNNLSESYFRAGQVDRAVALARRVRQADPDNMHALANLTRFLFLSGAHQEAEELGRQLRSLPVVRDDAWYKKCEALSFLGDDEGVLAVFEEGRKARSTKESTHTDALLYHVGATAHARRGDHRLAARYWRQALKICPALEYPAENLEDARSAVGQRNGPWYFPLRDWICMDRVTELAAVLKRPTQTKSDEAVTEAAQRFAEAHPELVRLVPALLDRGDKSGRLFAWQLAVMVETPELLDALREFCLSQRGPDKLRVETAQRLIRLGVLPSGNVRLWIDGQWRDLMLHEFEITSEPIGAEHTPEVNDWLYDGILALRGGNGPEAEKLFQRCLEREGEAPDLLNNLAMSYQLQGRHDEVDSLIVHIHEKWPDYFFGRIALANQAVKVGDWDTADGHLAILRQQRRLHTTEFTALAGCNIKVLLGRGNVKEARSWLELWRGVDPEHPDLPHFEALCATEGLLSGLRRFLPRSLNP